MTTHTKINILIKKIGDLEFRDLKNFVELEYFSVAGNENISVTLNDKSFEVLPKSLTSLDITGTEVNGYLVFDGISENLQLNVATDVYCATKSCNVNGNSNMLPSDRNSDTCQGSACVAWCFYVCVRVFACTFCDPRLTPAYAWQLLAIQQRVSSVFCGKIQIICCWPFCVPLEFHSSF